MGEGIRTWVAIGLEVAFFGVAIVWRSWVQWRRTGSPGFIRPHRGAPALELAGATGFVAAIVLLVAAPVVDAAGMSRFAVLDVTWAAVAGFLLILAGLVLTVTAQLSMGDSWRIGVDDSQRTELVTAGVFSRVRNPIFTGMLLAVLGFLLLIPNPVSLAAVVILTASLEIQVRRVEEPYLARTHGEVYEQYRARTGRFLPSLRTG